MAYDVLQQSYETLTKEQQMIVYNLVLSLCKLSSKPAVSPKKRVFGKFAGKASTYKMTKEEFYTVFDNVIQSKSYKEKGIYHYPVVPEKAKQFLI